MDATWTKLTDGTWGVKVMRCQPYIVEGEPIVVQTRSGEKKPVLLGPLVREFRVKGGDFVRVFKVQTTTNGRSL